MRIQRPERSSSAETGQGVPQVSGGSRGPKCKETLKELSTMCWTAQSTDCPGGTRRQSPLKDKTAHERGEPVPRKRGRPPTRCTGKTYYHIKACPHLQEQETRKFLRSLERGEQVQQLSSSSSAAVPGGAASSTTSPGETVLQSHVTVEVAPMTESSHRHPQKQRKVNRHTKQHVAVTSWW